MNPEEFQRLLFQGRGLPYVILQNQPTSNYNAVLLDACLYNSVHYPMVEPDRGEYYHAIVSQTPDPVWFKHQILASLRDLDEEMDGDLLCQFALIYAQQGDLDARRLLYEVFYEFGALGESIGTTEIITLDGVSGFLYAANVLGQAIALDPTCVTYDSILHTLQRTIDISPEELRHLAGNQHRFVGTYLDHIEQLERTKNQTTRPRIRESSFAALEAYIAELTQKPSYLQLTKWGRNANDADLVLAAQACLRQTTDHHLRAYLNVFAERRFPLDFQLLIPFVDHPDPFVVRPALQALAFFEHQDIRALAFALQQSPEICFVLPLLINNVQETDLVWLREVYEANADDEYKHDVGLGITDIFTENFISAAVPLLEQLYDQGPCSICRRKVVDILREHNVLSPIIANEFQYDVNSYS